ncbi:hypothetical protein Syn7502_00824 [Synechococcus sp. PCC 7502]|uniref:hypothetical protein n=1 Tax=Synechococcus sp. PCC 7502 TaxID=1173263 RepID=UPI00029F8D15|nr:hypothetical protein [Synechococcus sp. PCC 7502]AFY72956.1 hypothetical protein Syn7502_00824 [Synechococcus sp. PCC 7502]
MRLSNLGLITLIASVFAAPAFAGTPASISGSTTFISPAGFTSTVSGESVLPSGLIYNTLGATLYGSGTVTNSIAVAGGATPTFSTKASLTNPDAGATLPATDGSAVNVLPQFSLQGFSIAAESLSIGSSVAPTATVTPASFNQAAAIVLANAARATAGDGSAGDLAILAANGRTVRLDSSGNVVVGGSVTGTVYASGNIDFISAIIKAGAGVNGLD